LVLTLGGLPDDLANRNPMASGKLPAVITLACVAAFAFGHRQGQDKSASVAKLQLELDRQRGGRYTTRCVIHRYTSRMNLL
jgi:hypothetical protein